MNDTQEIVTYSAPRRPQSPGIGPLTLVPSVVGMVAFAAAIITMMSAGLLAGVLVLLVTVLVGVPVVMRRRQRPLYSVAAGWWRFRVQDRSGATMAQTGLTGATPDGRKRLPGLLAKLECWSVESDGMGRPFALIQIPRAHQWAVVFRVVPEGGALVDPDTRDHKVAAWGHLLAMVGRTNGVRQVAAVLESLPDVGAMLGAHVSSILHPAAPAFAREVMVAAARELPQGVASSTGFVAVTFSEFGLGATGTAAERAEMCKDEIGRLLPELTVALNQSGAATATPLTAYDLTRRIKEAFNPDAALGHSHLAAAGDPPQIEWEDCGPVAARERYNSYGHDGATSVTFEALRIRPGVYTDTVLDRLLRPTPDARRKRITLLYRPTPEAEAAEVLDSDVKASLNRAGRRRGLVHAQDSAAVESARQAAQDEAAGAGVVDLSLLVTVTVTEPDDLARACSAVLNAGRSSRFTLDRVYGGQAAAFAFGLGLGLSPADLSVVPELLRDHT